jgi:polyisoprenoid-binding protein YceI
MVDCEKAKVHGELVVGIGMEVAINRNGFGVELESKNFKA